MAVLSSAARCAYSSLSAASSSVVCPTASDLILTCPRNDGLMHRPLLALSSDEANVSTTPQRTPLAPRLPNNTLTTTRATVSAHSPRSRRD